MTQTKIMYNLTRFVHEPNKIYGINPYHIWMSEFTKGIRKNCISERSYQRKKM